MNESESPSLQILRRPEELRQELIHLQERHAEYRDRCMNITANIEHERVSSSRNIRGNENAVTACVATEAEILETREKLASATEAAEKLLQRLEALPGMKSYRNALVLRLRYLNNLSWPDVCAALRQNGFPVTARTVPRWCDAALEQLEKLEGGTVCEQHPQSD